MISSDNSRNIYICCRVCGCVVPWVGEAVRSLYSGETDARHPAKIGPTPGSEGTRRCTDPLLPTPRRDPGWVFSVTGTQGDCA